MRWLLSLFLAAPVFASEISSPVVPLMEIERARKRLYPGGRDEEDLKVQASLPESLRKQDERSIQREVFKSVFNQDMVDDTPDEHE